MATDRRLSTYCNMLNAFGAASREVQHYRSRYADDAIFQRQTEALNRFSTSGSTPSSVGIRQTHGENPAPNT